jgi:tripartite-type tricarboxylate transporter receptor subunit TctC
VIVGYGPGSGADVAARIIGQWLTDRLGQPFTIENRPGAGSTIGTEMVTRANPDGYTLHFTTVANAIAPSLYSNLSYNFIRDIVPIASISLLPNVMEVNPSVPTKTVREFIAYAKANPGKINMASSGIGTMVHLAGELFKMMTGIDMVHVPYRTTGAALADMLSGQAQVMFDNPISSIALIQSGKLRALAVTTATRLEVLPDTPTVGDFVPGYAASGWQGLGAPKNTPAEIVDKLNKEINVALMDSKIKMRLAELGVPVFATSPTEFSKFIAEETEKWAKVIKFAGIKAE